LGSQYLLEELDSPLFFAFGTHQLAQHSLVRLMGSKSKEERAIKLFQEILTTQSQRKSWNSHHSYQTRADKEKQLTFLNT
jgi:hypothetical protein